MQPQILLKSFWIQLSAQRCIILRGLDFYFFLGRLAFSHEPQVSYSFPMNHDVNEFLASFCEPLTFLTNALSNILTYVRTFTC